MPALLDYHRILLLTEGSLGIFTAKTAASLLRYRPADIAAVIDAHAAGQALEQLITFAPKRPILPSIAAARDLEPDAVFVGIHPSGGKLPEVFRSHLAAALERGIDVVSGLHMRLNADPEFRALADASGARIHDVRVPPADLPIARARARRTRARRVLLVGTDGNVGKMVAALELTRAAQARGLDAAFVATGQTGIMISGSGVALDAIPCDFAAGAVESAVCAVGDADLVFIEGQGSIAHPGFSSVTLATLHGACPDALILAHHAGRTHHRTQPEHPIPGFPMLRAAYEQAAALLHPTALVGVALNCADVRADVARRSRSEISRALALPVVDPVSEDVDTLLTACLAET